MLSTLAWMGCNTADSEQLASSSDMAVNAPSETIASDGQLVRALTADTIAELNLSDLSAAMVNGTYSSAQITSAYLARIEAIDKNGPALHSVIAVMPDALEQAKLLDSERKAGKSRGPLHGIPILLKDNIEVDGPLPTTAGSTALLANVTGRDAPVVARLRAAGAVILGKTNLSQWANIRSSNSTSGWSSIGGLVKNPHALKHNCSGSSSGSGAAAAASLAAGTVGTETDGSIVSPASACGVVGMKPTVGLVSRTYIVPISHSQDTAGPMTRTVKDAALMLTAMAGSDPADPATAEADRRKVDYAVDLTSGGLKGMRIGVLRDRIGGQPKTAAEFEKALGVLREQGAVLVDISDSGIDEGKLTDAEFKVLMIEFKHDINAYLPSLPPAVKSRTLAGLIAFNKTNMDSELTYFGQDLFEMAEAEKPLTDPSYQEARDSSFDMAGPQGIDRLLRQYKVQLLIQPTSGPVGISKLGKGETHTGPSASQLPAVSGYPHLTVPMGAVGGMPVGISFIGPKWSEHLLLKAGYAYEQAAKARIVPAYADR